MIGTPQTNTKGIGTGDAPATRGDGLEIVYVDPDYNQWSSSDGQHFSSDSGLPEGSGWDPDGGAGSGSSFSSGGNVWSAVAAVIGQIVNAATYRSRLKAQQQAQEELMRLQSELNEAQAQRDFERTKMLQEAMLKLQYALSSYSAQAARARAAGLNVGALFSNGAPAPAGDTGSGAGAGSGVGLGSVSQPNISGGMDAILASSTAALNAAKARQIEAETPDKDSFRDNYLADTAGKLAAAGRDNSAAALSRLSTRFQEAVMQDNIDTIHQKLVNLRSEGLRLGREIDNMDLDADIKRGVIRQQILDAFTVFYKWRMLESDMQVNDAKIADFRSQISLRLSQVSLNDATTRHIRAKTLGQHISNVEGFSRLPHRGEQARWERSLDNLGHGLFGQTIRAIAASGALMFKGSGTSVYDPDSKDGDPDVASSGDLDSLAADFWQFYLTGN